jgi:LysM repeat protein
LVSAWAVLATIVLGAWTNQAGATTVRVRPGTTLSQIARTYGTSLAALVADNGIGDPNMIEAGTLLQIPTTFGPETGSATGPATVIVSSGDTLWGIASRYDTTVAAIVDANGIGDPSHVEIGARLVVPAASTVGGVTGTGNGTVLSAQVQRSSLPAALLAHPERLSLRPLFERWAADFGVPQSLLEAMCWWESGWQNTVVSSTGAMGIGQLEPSTVVKLRVWLRQPGLEATDPSDNIEMAAAYLHHLLVQTGGDEGLALAGYYQGLNSVQRSGEFPSTVQYVHGILSFTDLFS